VVTPYLHDFFTARPFGTINFVMVIVYGNMQYMLSVHDALPNGNNCTHNSHKSYSDLPMQFVRISTEYVNNATAAGI